MPNYKGKKYSYDAKGKSAMKRDMMADAKGGKSSKKKAMMDRLKMLKKKRM
jgi:hypothetical protein